MLCVWLLDLAYRMSHTGCGMWDLASGIIYEFWVLASEIDIEFEVVR